MNQKGFSLAELLIAAAMTSLLMAGVFVILQQGENVYMFGAGRAEVQQTARGALDRIARELRTGSLVTAATANTITFNYIDDAGATITAAYAVNGTDLQRNGETVIGGVTAFTLSYYDANNALLTAPIPAADVRTVNVRLATQVQGVATTNNSPANQRAMVEDRVRMRNLL
jgi:prepilin-type N-terminal cleavage/methylation domain-containing protein